MANCEGCITDKRRCEGCRDNPEYAAILQLPSLYQDYKPACPLGKIDCVVDPAYIHHHHPEWYKELYGDKTPQEAAQECRERLVGSEQHGWTCYDYDDEDK